MQSATPKRISCKRCQKRKIKCSRTYPCISCSSAGAACEFRDDGMRKFPISRDYVDSLERRVAVLETFITKVKAASPDERNAIIDDITFLDHYQPFNLKHETEEHDKEKRESLELAALVEDNGVPGSVTYHGPTSIYNGAFVTPNTSSLYPASSLPGPLEYELDAGERIINECIGMFFRWQYSQFMFVDRQAFILDYQNRVFDGEFCSSALINAICSIGASMSTDIEIRAKASSFAEAASGLLFAHSLATPHTTSVQALLCSAFYEIGNGNLSRGWLYSGMAFRMGQGLGIQRDPRTWPRKHLGNYHLIEEYRRRIYWGCYVSDKFFSLYFGRPCVMLEPDADVKPCQPMPQTGTFNDWAEARGLDHLKDEIPTSPGLAATFNKQIEIARIIQEGLSKLHLPAAKIANEWTAIALNEVDAKLTRFREQLPADMRLKEWSTLGGQQMQPKLAVLDTLLYSTRISLHRPFLNAPRRADLGEQETASSLWSGSQQICLESVEHVGEILKRFRAQWGLRHAPPALVHGAITALNAVTSLARHGGGKAAPSCATHLALLESVLQDMAPTWKIAGTMLARSRGQRISSGVGQAGMAVPANDEMETQWVSMSTASDSPSNMGFDACTDFSAWGLGGTGDEDMFDWFLSPVTEGRSVQPS